MHEAFIFCSLCKERLLMTVTISCFRLLCVHEIEPIISNKHHFKCIYILCKHLVLEYNERFLNLPATARALNQKTTCSAEILYINDFREANLWSSGMVFR
jgi:hypothetical protein